MSLEEYEASGNKHTEKDQEVDIEFVKKNETNINITHTLSVAPLYLLYKDHKGWTVEMGGSPPSRPEASTGSGQNDNFSEVASIMLEPVAN